jgi:pimeloyl-ACP methyl ester carboxylesterase
MDDIRAVMDAARSERAVVVGIEEGFSLAAMFAATYPERTLALIGWAASARSLWAPHSPGPSPHRVGRGDPGRRATRGGRSSPRGTGQHVFPDLAEEEERIDRLAAWVRATGGPGDAVSLSDVDRETDIRDLLAIVRRYGCRRSPLLLEQRGTGRAHHPVSPSRIRMSYRGA